MQLGQGAEKAGIRLLEFVGYLRDGFFLAWRFVYDVDIGYEVRTFAKESYSAIKQTGSISLWSQPSVQSLL
jgi:hypothetical protein